MGSRYVFDTRGCPATRANASCAVENLRSNTNYELRLPCSRMMQLKSTSKGWIYHELDPKHALSMPN